MADVPLWDHRIHMHDDARVVTLSGELDLAAGNRLRHLLVGQLDRADGGTLVADLSAVTFMDSAALGALLAACNHADNIGRRFRITGAAGNVLRILQIAGVDQLLAGTLSTED